MSEYIYNFPEQQIIGWILKGIQLRPENRGFDQKFRVMLRRAHMFYFWRVILILGLVSLMTLGVFASDTGLDYISTMFLTAVAYMFIINEYLPTLNYLTLLDKYVMFALFYVFIIGAEIAVLDIGFSDHSYGEEINERILIIDAAIWVIVHIYLAIIAKISFNTESKKLILSKEDFFGNSDGSESECKIQKSSETNDSKEYPAFICKF